MGTVFIDNWNLQNIFCAVDQAIKKWVLSEAYLDLLNAMILWDKIYYIDRKAYTKY